VAYISGAVEGISDEAVLRRVVIGRGAVVHRVQVQRGKANLRRALPGYNAAAQGDPWLVLVDLDNEFGCAAALATNWLPAPSAFMRFRVVVRKIEAWLLADHERFTRFFSVPASAVPVSPDELADPKATVLNAIRRSQRMAIRADMLPRPSSGRPVGPAYTSRLIEFASDGAQGWRPDVAARRSPSLSSCLTRLDSLIAIAP
jgi:hypothetical protein